MNWRVATAACAEMREKRVLNKGKAPIAKVKFRVHVGFAALFNDLFLA